MRNFRQKTCLIMRSIILLAIVSLSLLYPDSCSSQSASSEKNFRRNPLWIGMMDDSTSNYHETLRAFDLYWENHEMPVEEDQILGQKGATEVERKEKSGWLARLFRGKRSEAEGEMAFQVKRFRHWQIMISPFVRDDGSIPFPSERAQILQNINR